MSRSTLLWKKCAVVTMAMGATFSMGAAQYPDAGSTFNEEAAVTAETITDQVEKAVVAEEEKAEEREPVEVTLFEVPEDAKFLERRSLKSGREAEVYEETIDHPVREISDNKLPEGVKIVVKEGADGLTEHVDVAESSSGYSKKVSSPVEEVVRVGTGGSAERAPLIDPALVVMWEEEAEEQRLAEEEAAEREAEEEAEREEAEREEAEREAEEERQAEEEAEEAIATSEERSSSNSGNNNSSSSSSSRNESSSSSSNSNGYANSPRAGASCGGWGDMIEEHFGSAQYDKACSVMMCESRGDSKAQNPVSTASGLYQFLDTTWYAARGAVGGGEYARAMDAPAEMQIEAAAKWQQRTNWGQWVCQ